MDFFNTNKCQVIDPANYIPHPTGKTDFGKFEDMFSGFFKTIIKKKPFIVRLTNNISGVDGFDPIHFLVEKNFSPTVQTVEGPSMVYPSSSFSSPVSFLIESANSKPKCFDENCSISTIDLDENTELVVSLTELFGLAIARYNLRQLEKFFKDSNHVKAAYRRFRNYCSCSVQLINRSQTRDEINTLLLMAGVEPNPGPNGRPKQKTFKKKRQKRMVNRAGPAASGNTIRMNRGLGFPDSWTSNLEYIIPIQQVLGGGTTNSLRFTSNAYDVDSALASTAMAGFAEFAAVYSRFRTLSMAYEFRVSNSEAFPIAMIHGFMTNQLGSTALGQNYVGNPHMHTSICSNVNGSTSSRTFRGKVSACTLFGGKQPLYDDLFIGSTTSSTLSNSATMNCYIGAVSSAIPVNGWFVTGFIKLKVLFIRRNAILV